MRLVLLIIGALLAVSCTRAGPPPAAPNPRETALREEFKHEIQSLARGGEARDAIAIYMGTLGMSPAGVTSGEPDWSNIQVTAVELGTVLFAPDSPRDNAGILYATVPQGGVLHKLAYVGLFSGAPEQPLIFRREVVDVDDTVGWEKFKKDWDWRPLAAGDPDKRGPSPAKAAAPLPKDRYDAAEVLSGEYTVSALAPGPLLQAGQSRSTNHTYLDDALASADIQGRTKVAIGKLNAETFKQSRNKYLLESVTVSLSGVKKSTEEEGETLNVRMPSRETGSNFDSYYSVSNQLLETPRGKFIIAFADQYRGNSDEAAQYPTPLIVMIDLTTKEVGTTIEGKVAFSGDPTPELAGALTLAAALDGASLRQIAERGSQNPSSLQTLIGQELAAMRPPH